VALAVTVAAVVVAGGLTVLGGATLANSRAGRNAADSLPVLSLPKTPTALLGTVDGDGELASAAVFVLDPSGRGGSVVSIAPNADSTLDLGDDRLPLDETLATEGPEVFRLHAESLTSLSFDVAELADAGRLTALLEPFGPLDVALPREIEVEVGGDEVVLGEGLNQVDAATAAALLTTVPEDGPDHQLEPVRDAVWSAVAEAASAAGGAPIADGQPSRPNDVDTFVDRLSAGEVGWRNLRYEVPPASRNPRGVDVVVPDRAEVLVVMGHIAPGRVAAPNPSLTFRIEGRFPDDVLQPLGVNRADVVADAVARLLFVQANVVSVDTEPGDPPPVTRAYVADESVIDVIAESYPLVFGELEVIPAEYRIAGVDVIVELGDSYLAKLAGEGLTDDDLDGTVFAPETTVSDADERGEAPTDRTGATTERGDTAG
jgi:hypothetical protein